MNPWEATEDFQGDVKTYYGNLSKHFARFQNNLFVETGTFLGNGLQCALDAGFSKCYSIEIHKHLYDKAVARFKPLVKSGMVVLYNGDSSFLLDGIVKELNEPATFWIDAHISSQYGEKLAKNCPVLEEFDCIEKSPIKNHTFLIDDLNCFGRGAHDRITIDQVKQRILKINKNYKFEFLDAHIPGNIMAAYV